MRDPHSFLSPSGVRAIRAVLECGSKRGKAGTDAAASHMDEGAATCLRNRFCRKPADIPPKPGGFVAHVIQSHRQAPANFGNYIPGLTP